MIKPCQSKNSQNWFSEEIPSSSVLDENVKKLEFYKQYREISDITEKIDIAMDGKQVYKCVSGSTKNTEIDLKNFNYTGLV